MLESLPLARNSDDFIFDNQMLAQAIYRRYRIGEISCPTKYFPEASSINFRRSVIYGLGVLRTSLGFRLARLGFAHGTIFEGLQGNGSIRRPSIPSTARAPSPERGRVGWGSRAHCGQDPHPAAIASQVEAIAPTSPFQGEVSRGSALNTIGQHLRRFAHFEILKRSLRPRFNKQARQVTR